MSERIKLLGRKAELKDKLEELELRAENHIITIRNLVDPFERFDKLKTKQALQAMKSLDSLVSQALEAREQLERVLEELGE